MSTSPPMGSGGSGADLPALPEPFDTICGLFGNMQDAEEREWVVYTADQMHAYARASLAAAAAEPPEALIAELLEMVENYADLVGETYGHPVTRARQIHIDAITRRLRKVLAAPIGAAAPAEPYNLSALEQQALGRALVRSVKFTDEVQGAAAVPAQPVQPEPAEPADQIIELAEALQVRRILEEIKKVAALQHGGDMPTPYQSAWAACCEEIFFRATGEQWHMDEDGRRPCPQGDSACPVGSAQAKTGSGQ